MPTKTGAPRPRAGHGLGSAMTAERTVVKPARVRVAGSKPARNRVVASKPTANGRTKR
jgi:hypothetical protein